MHIATNGYKVDGFPHQVCKAAAGDATRQAIASSALAAIAAFEPTGWTMVWAAIPGKLRPGWFASV